MQASAGFLDPKTKTNASKIVRFLESCTANISDAGGGSCDSDLAATASSIGHLSLTTTAAGRADFNMLTKELQATSQTVTGNMQRLIEHYRRGGQGIVMTGSNLMSLCLCALGPSDLSSGDIFNSQEIISMMKTLLMMRPHFPITYCVSLPLPGVLGQETVKSLNGKGRPVEWMPSFMCLHPIACKAPSSWRMPSASFDFHCDHVPSHPGRTFCTQCKQASRPRCMVFFSLSIKQVLLKPTSVWMLCRVVAYCCHLEFLSKIMAAPLSWHVVQASIRNGWSIARHTPAARLSLYYVAYSDAIHICCIRSSLPIFHSCFGAACAIFRFFQIFTQFPRHSFPSLEPLQHHDIATAPEIATEETWEMYRRERVFKCSNERCLVLAPYHGIESATLRACSSCKVARYCSPECQAADRSSHQAACASFKRA